MEQVDISMDDGVATAPVTLPGDQVQNPADIENADMEPRPDWLPEKFQNTRQMAEAYSNLERKMGQQSEPLSEDSGIGDLQAVPKSLTSETLAQYTQEYADNGNLSENSYKDLETKGVDRTAVDAYIAGQRALVEANLQTVYNEVGGQQQYADLMDFAVRNLPESEINAFNEQVQAQRADGSLDMDRAMFAIKGLKAQKEAVDGSTPQLITGGAGSASGNVFKSTAQVVAAMQDPRYENDPAYRQEVMDRLSVSDVF